MARAIKVCRDCLTDSGHTVSGPGQDTATPGGPVMLLEPHEILGQPSAAAAAFSLLTSALHELAVGGMHHSFSPSPPARTCAHCSPGVKVDQRRLAEKVVWLMTPRVGFVCGLLMLLWGGVPHEGSWLVGGQRPFPAGTRQHAPEGNQRPDALQEQEAPLPLLVGQQRQDGRANHVEEQVGVALRG